MSQVISSPENQEKRVQGEMKQNSWISGDEQTFFFKESFMVQE